MNLIEEKIKHQEDFVKAISYQHEVAINAFYEALRYKDYITERLTTETNYLNKLKEQNVQ